MIKGSVTIGKNETACNKKNIPYPFHPDCGSGGNGIAFSMDDPHLVKNLC